MCEKHELKWVQRHQYVLGPPVIGRIGAPKDVHILIHGTGGKRDMADVINIQDFGIERLDWIIWMGPK